MNFNNFKYGTSFPTDDGKGIVVVLNCNNPYAVLPIELYGEFNEKEITNLEFLKEQIFKQWFGDRAKVEAIQKVDELEKLIEKYDELLKQANTEFETKIKEVAKSIEESNQSTERNNQLIKTVTLTVNELISRFLGEEDEENDEETEES